MSDRKITELKESKIDFTEILKTGKIGTSINSGEMMLLLKGIAENQKAIYKLAERITMLEDKLEIY